MLFTSQYIDVEILLNKENQKKHPHTLIDNPTLLESLKFWLEFAAALGSSNNTRVLTVTS